MLPSYIHAEVNTLAQRYGQPKVVRFSASQVPVDIEKRDAEILPVIRRPSGRLILMTKTHYPGQVFRLPTGGIEVQEPIEHALWREVAEETRLQVELERFLAILIHERTTPQPPFLTFAFLLNETGGNLACIDPDEGICAFTEILPQELYEVAARLRAIDADTHWRRWGNFRAVSHELVACLLLDQNEQNRGLHVC